MAHFEAQNRRMQNGTLVSPLRNTTYLQLDVLGITNGCVDARIEAPFYPHQAFNNTYGLQAITEEVYEQALGNLTMPDGCYDLIDQCRAIAAADPENTASNMTINEACAAASTFCFGVVQGAFTATSGVSSPTLHSTLGTNVDVNLAKCIRYGPNRHLCGSNRVRNRLF